MYEIIILYLGCNTFLNCLKYEKECLTKIIKIHYYY